MTFAPRMTARLRKHSEMCARIPGGISPYATIWECVFHVEKR